MGRGITRRLDYSLGFGSCSSWSQDQLLTAVQFIAKFASNQCHYVESAFFRYHVPFPLRNNFSILIQELDIITASISIHSVGSRTVMSTQLGAGRCSLFVVASNCLFIVFYVHPVTPHLAFAFESAIENLDFEIVTIP